MNNGVYDFEMLNTTLAKNSKDMEQALAKFFDEKQDKGSLKIIKDAQMYSLLGCGKRIRPFLTNSVCEMLGGSVENSMPFAMAVEMIHTYSLIHDDLPCMDDDDMRRGRPSNHKVFGEATAVLAGDALLTNAFSAATSNREMPYDMIAEAVSMIAEAAGDGGMIGGQIIDMEGEQRRLSFEELLTLHALKTGKMIELSAALGCVAAGFGKNTVEFQKITSYARDIGLVFQIVDDILDVIGDEKVVGKSLASDAENEKTTFLSFFNVDEARKYAEDVSNKAIESISGFKNAEMLSILAIYLLNRSN